MNLTADEVQKMKVVELRAELTNRGLDARGVKAVLTERLLSALEEAPGGEDSNVSPIEKDNGAVSESVGNGSEAGGEVDGKEEEVTEKEDVPAASPVKAAIVSTEPSESLSPSKSTRGVTPSREKSPVKGSPSPAKVVPAPTPAPATPTTSVVKTESMDTSIAAPVPAVEESTKLKQSESSQNQESLDENKEQEPEAAVVTKVESEESEDTLAAEVNESMEVDQEADSNKRKIEDVNGESETKTADAEPGQKRAKTESEPVVKIIPEHEPDFDSDAVLLDWYKSDLNLKISEENFLQAEPWNIEEFPFAYAGVKSTYGFTKGKLYYEVKWLESSEIKQDFGDLEKKHILRLGWSDLSTGLQLGEEKVSYGWDSTGKLYKGDVEDFGEVFDKDDVVGTLLNLDSDPVELKFTKNGAIVGTTVEISKEDLEGKILFPHILTRNVKFEVNFGASDPLYTLEEEDGVVMVGNAEPSENRVRGPVRPDTKAECEFIMLCGLAGCGKTKWSKDYVAANTDKNYNILGTSTLVERSLKDQATLSSNTNKSYDGFFQKAGKFVEKLIEIAPSRRRNYILDQSNVVAGAQRRKSGGFQGFKRRAVVIVPSDEEYQKRIKCKEQEQGKSVPKSTILDMKAGFRLPDVGEIFSAVDFVDLDREEAQKLITKYNKEGVSAGFGRPIPSRGGSRNAGRSRGRGGPRGAPFRGGSGGGWRGRGGPPMGGPPRGGYGGGGPRGGFIPRGMPPIGRGGPRGGGLPPRGGGPPRGLGGPRGPARGMGGPPRILRNGGGPPRGAGGSGSWRGGGGPSAIPTRASQGRNPRRDMGGSGGRGGGGSWRGGDGNTFVGRGGPRHQGHQGNWGQQQNRPSGGGGGYGGGYGGSFQMGGGGGGGNYQDPWQQVPDQGFGQSWDSSGGNVGRGGGTWQGYGGQTYGYGSGGRR